MFLSCRPASFGQAGDEAYGHLAEWGVRFVEISMPKAENAARVQEDLQRHGLSVGSMQVAVDLGDVDLPERMDEAARRVREQFGSTRIFTSAHAGKLSLETAYDALRRVGDAAGRHGVTVMLETHPDLGTSGAVAAVTMRAVDHPHVRINWDPANVYFYNERCDGRAEFDQAVPYLAGVHLKDTGGGFRSWDFPALGEGVVDFQYILKRLVDIGFDGPCTMEIEGVKGEKLSREQYVERVRKSVDHVRGLGYFRP